MIRTIVQVGECDITIERFGMSDGGGPIVDIVLCGHDGGEVRLECKSADDLDMLGEFVKDASRWFFERETRHGIQVVK